MTPATSPPTDLRAGPPSRRRPTGTPPVPRRTPVPANRSPATGSVSLAKTDTIIEASDAVQLLGLGLGSGDLDGESVDEILVGAPFDASDGAHSGAAFVVITPPTGTWSIPASLPKT